MIEKAFLVGRPGSGKSSVARIIDMLVRDYGWLTDHVCDYKLLQDLFLEEQKLCTPCEKKLFRPRGPQNLNGFDVVDFSILDIVLKKLEDNVRVSEADSLSRGENKLFLLEFARSDYNHAFQQFSDKFLEGAHFLYLRADMAECISRIHRRIVHPISFYDHFVSDEIMKDYYYEDDWQPYICKLKQDNYQHIHEVSNSSSTDILIKSIKSFVDVFLKKEKMPKETSEKIVTSRVITTGPLELEREELIEALA